MPDPLDFSETLDLLASWAGRVVEVSSYRTTPGRPASHTMTTMAGPLGEVQMVDNAIDLDADSVAGFSVGDVPPNGFYVSPGDFEMAQSLAMPGLDSVRLDFRDGYSIQITARAERA